MLGADPSVRIAVRRRRPAPELEMYAAGRNLRLAAGSGCRGLVDDLASVQVLGGSSDLVIALRFSAEAFWSVGTSWRWCARISTKSP